MSAPQRKPLKYLPKSSARKTEQERDAIARGEDERERKRRNEAARDLETERRRGGASSARGGPSSRGAREGEASSGGGNRTTLRYARGGRGGFMGEALRRGGLGRGSRDDKPAISAVEDAPFPSTTVAPASRELGLDGRTTRSSQTGSGSKSVAKPKKEPEEIQGLPIFQDPTKRRINVEEINLITPEDSGDEDAMNTDDESQKPKLGLASVRASGSMPVRIRRREHIERAVGINTEASSSAAAEIRKKWQEGEGENEVEGLMKSTLAMNNDNSAHATNIVDETKQWENEDAVSDQEGQTTETRVEVKQEPNKSPTRRRKSITSPSERRPRASTSPVAKRQSKSRASESKRSKKAGQPSGWDAQDWETEQKDRGVLRRELGRTAYRVTNDEADDAGTEQVNHRSNNIYLFQFPPVMPDLIDLAKNVKKEEPQSPELSRAHPPADGDKSVPDISLASVKIDDDAEGDFTVESNGDNSKRAAAQDEQNDERKPKLTAGKAGKLRVHESGRITLSWGGVSFEVRRGMDRSFLQTAILTSDTTHMHDDVQYDGNATSLGQVRGKFIVVPDADDVMP